MRLDDVFTCWTFKLRRLGASVGGWGEEQLCLSIVVEGCIVEGRRSFFIIGGEGGEAWIDGKDSKENEKIVLDNLFGGGR